MSEVPLYIENNRISGPAWSGANEGDIIPGIFIMNTISLRRLEPFLQKLCKRLQCPGEESCSL